MSTDGNKRGGDGRVECHPDGAVPRYVLRPTQRADINLRVAMANALDEGRMLARMVLRGHGDTETCERIARSVVEMTERVDDLRAAYDRLQAEVFDGAPT